MVYDGDEFRQAHAASLSRQQKRVLRSIELCRTAALGGHLVFSFPALRVITSLTLKPECIAVADRREWQGTQPSAAAVPFRLNRRVVTHTRFDCE